MPPELRKRKAPAAEPAAAPPTKKKGPVAKAVAKVKEVVTGSPKAAKTNGSSSATKVAVGDVVPLEGFGGEIETNDGVKTTLQKLVKESTGGVIIFTYPKASTPGCKYYVPESLYQQILMNFRHKSSLFVPRFILQSYIYRILHLWSIQRLAKGQHDLQGEAETPISTSV